jgi:hypothetical protein
VLPKFGEHPEIGAAITKLEMALSWRSQTWRPAVALAGRGKTIFRWSLRQHIGSAAMGNHNILWSLRVRKEFFRNLLGVLQVDVCAKRLIEHFIGF